MKAVIIITVPEYDRVSSLPACQQDGEEIERLARATGSFDIVHAIDGRQSSREVKDQLASWIASVRSEKFDQVLFYYSGHGLVDGDEFHYVLRDYSAKSLKRTTIENSEVDTYLRQLDAELVVKVVDACHSGTPYIKDISRLKSALETSVVRQFKHCYFLFSSQADETSWADSTLSYFTRAFLHAAEASAGRDLRYKEIMDDVSDAFRGQVQTPIFVTQATFTESFGSIPPDYKVLQPKPDGSSGKVDGAKELVVAPPVSELLLAAVRKDASRYLTKEQAEEVLRIEVGQRVETFEFPSPFAQLYEKEVAIFREISEVPDLLDVAKWVHSSKSDYMVNVEYIEEEYTAQVPMSIENSSINDMLASALNIFGSKTIAVKKTRQIPTRISSIAAVTPECISVFLRRKLPNVREHRCWLVPVLSRTDIRLFWASQSSRDDGWRGTLFPSRLSWSTQAAPLADSAEVRALIDRVLGDFSGRVYDELKQAFLPGYTEEVEVEVIETGGLESIGSLVEV